MQFGNDFLPQHAGFHHIVLFRRGHLIAALARQLESHGGDALDLVGVVDLGVDGALLAIAEVDDLLRLAEIDAAGQLAHDHDVEAFDDLTLERRSVGQRRIAYGGPQIGEETEILAQAQQARLGPHVVGNIGPFRAADRRQHYRVGGLRQRHVRFADRVAMRVIGRAADQAFFEFERGEARFGNNACDLFDFRRHFGTDAVARQKQDFIAGHIAPLFHFRARTGSRIELASC